MINRDFSVKVHTFDNYKIFLLLEVLIKEDKFTWNQQCKIVDVTINPVAILVIETVENKTHLFQFAQSNFLQSELKKLFKKKIERLINK